MFCMKTSLLHEMHVVDNVKKYRCGKSQLNYNGCGSDSQNQVAILLDCSLS